MLPGRAIQILVEYNFNCIHKKQVQSFLSTRTGGPLPSLGLPKHTHGPGGEVRMVGSLFQLCP